MSKMFLKFLTVIVSVCVYTTNAVSYKDSSVIERFRGWVDKFQIISRDDHHLAHMFESWLSNDKYIDLVNRQNLTYTLGHNAYSGLNSDEFSELMGFRANKEMLSKQQVNSYLRGTDISGIQQSNILDLPDVNSLPASVDWRSNGVVNHIMNQAQCGSCWAFSGTSTLESAVAIKTGNLYDLSEQQSVSCSTVKQGYTNLGCNGGMYDAMWKYVTNNGGVCSESSYPYSSGLGDTGSCLKTCSVVSGTKVTNHVVVTPNSDSAMMTALSINPVSIAIEADTKSFQLYSSGIYSDFTGCGGNSPQLDHAVVLVGYGSSNGQDYYIMRNSWGTTWGDLTDGSENKGYMLMARGSAYGKAGLCGLLSEPMYPIV